MTRHDETSPIRRAPDGAIDVDAYLREGRRARSRAWHDASAGLIARLRHGASVLPIRPLRRRRYP